MELKGKRIYTDKDRNPVINIKPNEVLFDPLQEKNIYFDKKRKKYVEGPIPKTWYESKE